MRYVGRFAPSPTGPLHAGSLAAALGSWLDARAHDGRWLVRIEDVDTPRCVPGAVETILAQLAGCGLMADETPLHQSTRDAAYRSALDSLLAAGLAYSCGCSRSEIDEALAAAGRAPRPNEERPYPGTCRGGLNGKPARAIRLRTDGSGVASNDGEIHWNDRRLGPQRQHLGREVGDFVLRRADGLWAYQLAVVVDDAFQRVTDVVRGEDLADNTPRQIHLQRCLGLPTPAYLHLPLVRDAEGRKLSKQSFAEAVRPGAEALRDALAALAVPVAAKASRDIPALLGSAVAAWRDRPAESR